MSALDTAVILAAGRGVRLKPLTDTVPKAMIDIGGKPLLERIVGEAIAAGVTRIVFIVGHLGGVIEDYFRAREKDWGAHFTFIRQETLNGTGSALQLAEKQVRGSFLTIFGDSFFAEGTVGRMMNTPWDSAIGVIEVPDPSRYGIVEISKDGAVTSIVEKPQAPRSNLAIAGVYKFQSAIWAELRALTPSQRGELEIPDAVRGLIAKGRPFGTVALDFMADIGTHQDLKRIRDMVGSAKS